MRCVSGSCSTSRIRSMQYCRRALPILARCERPSDSVASFSGDHPGGFRAGTGRKERARRLAPPASGSDSHVSLSLQRARAALGPRGPSAALVARGNLSNCCWVVFRGGVLLPTPAPSRLREGNAGVALSCSPPAGGRGLGWVLFLLAHSLRQHRRRPWTAPIVRTDHPPDFLALCVIQHRRGQHPRLIEEAEVVLWIEPGLQVRVLLLKEEWCDFAAPSMSWEIVRTRNFPSLSDASLLSIGISSTQGPHQVAQRFTRTGVPLRSVSFSVLPEGSVTLKAGMAFPRLVMSRVPLNSPFAALSDGVPVVCGCESGAACLSHPATASAASRTIILGERTDMSGNSGSNQMWGGRFAGGPSAIMREINASIPFDKALWRQDIAASKAHVDMLGAQSIVSSEDAALIAGGLDQVAAEYEANGVPENWDLEDIHMTTESRLAELVGPAAGRLHTARSRNDQVATDFRLWVRDAMRFRAEHGLAAAPSAPSSPAPVNTPGQHHARLHPPANRAAGHPRPPPDGLLRDGRARPSRALPMRARG